MSEIQVGATAYRLDAVRDTLDFRDLLFTPTLVEVPVSRALEEYRAAGVPILDQGTEGACTGFGLATVIHYLLRRRRPTGDEARISPRMLYEMAKRYDEWPGEAYEGSSARGAMKGWHKHGVCAETKWPYHGKAKKAAERWEDARLRPLGAYFRVNHLDLIAMHAAIAEVGVLYATATVHQGWSDVKADGRIEPSDRPLGGHAFAIVAYDREGFWIQNSWGPDWGKDGFGHVTYDDWLANGTDVWVARLGAPVLLKEYRSTAVALQPGARGSAGYGFGDLRPHIVSTGNDGRLRADGTYGTDEEEVRHIFRTDFPATAREWKQKRLLLYAHGGLVPEEAAVQRVADYRSALLEAQVYPVSFIWKTDFWTTLKYILEDGLRRRRPEGILDAAKDFMLDRLDDALEPVARAAGGRAQWDEMKENALRATTGVTGAKGGARIAAEHVAALAELDGVELHLAAHSAGSIYFARLVQMLTADRGRPLFRGVRGLGLPIRSLTLWAPAITIDLFKQTCLPAIREGRIERFALFTLTDHAELDDDCAKIYNKSLLYLVSHAFEETPFIPLIDSRQGEPILGMERWVKEDLELMDLFESGQAEWITAPNAEPAGSPSASRARSHGDFDDDEATVRATLARILAGAPAGGPIRFERSAASRRAERETLMQLS